MEAGKLVITPVGLGRHCGTSTTNGNHRSDQFKKKTKRETTGSTGRQNVF